jgi:hypothetical protein
MNELLFECDCCAASFEREYPIADRRCLQCGKADALHYTAELDAEVTIRLESQLRLTLHGDR